MSWNELILGDVPTDWIHFENKWQQNDFLTFIQPTSMNTLTQIIMIPIPWNLAIHPIFFPIIIKSLAYIFQNTHLTMPLICLKPFNEFQLLLG